MKRKTLNKSLVKKLEKLSEICDKLIAYYEYKREKFKGHETVLENALMDIEGIKNLNKQVCSYL